MSSYPGSLAELDSALSKIFTSESREHGLAFRPRASDVIISPYAKSGTTWLQQIAHGLRSRGSMDFEEITEATPWLEMALDLDWDLDADQSTYPRLYKSHLSWHEVPKGGRYICAFRHPHDVAVSLYRFLEGFLFEPGSISIEALTRWHWPHSKLHESGYWQHLLSWWQQRDNPAVLLLCYEDMLADLPGTVRKVADHIGVRLDEQLFELVLQQSSREFMLANHRHFDDSYIRRLARQRAGIPEGEADKVTPGSQGQTRYRLSAELKAELDVIWKEQIESRLGLKNYMELRRELQ